MEHVMAEDKYECEMLKVNFDYGLEMVVSSVII